MNYFMSSETFHINLINQSINPVYVTAYDLEKSFTIMFMPYANHTPLLYQNG